MNRIRKTINYYKKLSKQVYLCNTCGYKKLKRVRSGVFKCTKCNNSVTGDAYNL